MPNPNGDAFWDYQDRNGKWWTVGPMTQSEFEQSYGGAPQKGPFATHADAVAAISGGGGGNGGGGNGGGGGGGPKDWYVVTFRPNPKTPFEVKAMKKPFPPPPAQTLIDSGPYTQSEAQQKASQLQHNPAPGFPGGSAVGDTVAGITDVANVLTAFYRNLTDVNFWRSVGWLLLGIVLLIYGLYIWLTKEGVLPEFNAGDAAALAAA